MMTVDPNTVRGSPTGLDASMDGGEQPPTFFGSVPVGFNATVAAGGYSYYTHVERLYDENAQKLKEAGFNPPALFYDNRYYTSKPYEVFTGAGAHKAASDFQAIMNEHSPFPGVDERYQEDNYDRSKFRTQLNDVRGMIYKAQIARPDLGIKSMEDIHNEAIGQIKHDLLRAADPRAPTGSMLMQMLGGAPAILGESNPYAAYEAMSWFIAPGSTTVGRIVGQGVLQAGLSYLETEASRPIYQQVFGTDLDNSDIIKATIGGFIGGAIGQGIGEFAIGKNARLALNESRSWMSLSKRAARQKALEEQAYGPLTTSAGWRPGEPVPPATPAVPVAPSPDVPTGGQVKLTMPEWMNPPPAIAATVPRGDRVRLGILQGLADEKATQVRWAVDLDHIAPQLDMPGVTVHDLIPPTRPMDSAATNMPAVRVNNGPSLIDPGQTLNMTPGLQRRILGWGIDTVKDFLNRKFPGEFDVTRMARELDPETFAKFDKINAALRKATAEFTTASRFREAAKAGDVKALAEHIQALEAKASRTKGAEGLAKVQEEIAQAQQYAEQLRGTRLGEGAPPPSRAYDVVALRQRVEDVIASRDAVFQDLERAVARADKAWSLKKAESEALDRELRAEANDYVGQPWRDNKPRPRNAKKTSYEKTLDRAEKEFMAEKKPEPPQLQDPLATKNPKANETMAETATRVNKLRIDEQADLANEFAAQAKKLTEILAANKGKLPAEKPVKPGEAAPEPPPQVIPAQWAHVKAFEAADGQPVNLKDFLQDVADQEQSMRAFNACKVKL